jgi:hypothetical protein
MPDETVDAVARQQIARLADDQIRLAKEIGHLAREQTTLAKQQVELATLLTSFRESADRDRQAQIDSLNRITDIVDDLAKRVRTEEIDQATNTSKLGMLGGAILVAATAVASASAAIVDWIIK